MYSSWARLITKNNRFRANLALAILIRWIRTVGILQPRRSAMVDTLSKEKRSWLMSQVSSKNTKPELAVRSLLHGIGYRFRLHASDLPGKPDIVFRSRKKVIFVHGCFWHGHQGCKYAKLPGTHVDFWAQKLDRNRMRDARILADLNAAGWQVYTIWQCEIKDLAATTAALKKFLGPLSVVS